MNQYIIAHELYINNYKNQDIKNNINFNYNMTEFRNIVKNDKVLQVEFQLGTNIQLVKIPLFWLSLLITHDFTGFISFISLIWIGFIRAWKIENRGEIDDKKLPNMADLI